MHTALRLWLTGVVLALLEVACTLLRGGALFLTAGERALYAVAAVGAISGCVLLLGMLVDLASRRALARWSLAGAAAFGAGLGAWLLTAGRRVHAAPWRLPAVASVTLVALLVAGVVLSRVAAERGARRPLPLVLAGLLAAACLVVDVLVLPRGYPAFHVTLFVTAVASAAVAGLSCLGDVAPRARVIAALAVLTVGSAPLTLARLAGHPTASFAVRESAPWLSDVLAAIDAVRPTPRPAPPTAVVISESTRAARVGVDLRDRDVLLISVDALRADLLRTYGGTGRTPVLDALADESAVFTRAYTPAPHTSYALASLLTGKFVKPLVALGGALGDPPTLPDRLRRYGYRTAAFYPPAIFFVDGARFDTLAQRGFGFEYRKEMFASADERIAQLSVYLEEADPKRPLFAWVHLFEPHEPYEPPPGSVHDDSERGRYEAEVAVCDRAIAALVARFRAARPRATVIVTADHGEEFGDHGGSFHGSTLYDEQVRVPLLWSSPGTVTPRRIDAPVELVDVGTTLLSTAGIPRDAHMRGDDLGPLLGGASDAGPLRAYASLDARHMITDGRFKAICDVREPHCALFDLVSDPRETRNLAGREAVTAARLRTELDAFLSSIPRSEALTVSAGVGMPEILAQARLGVHVRAPDLLPLLSDARAPVRAEAARQLGELGDAGARAALASMRAHESDARARAEAAVASLRLGDEAARADTCALLEDADSNLRRRAALALAARGHVEGLSVLAALVNDEGATESERLVAVAALASLRVPAAVPPLTAALRSVRLREAAAGALAVTGGDSARDVLAKQLRDERYPPARRAEAEALHALGDPRTAALVVRFLGMQSGLPGGLRLLQQLGALTPHGVLLADAGVRRGKWSCSAEGDCAPEADAAVMLPPRARALPGAVRVVLWYRGAEPGATLVVDGTRFVLSTSEDQLSLARPATALARGLPLLREGQVRVVAVAAVPARSEIPAPAPEPWDAGITRDASAR